MPSLILSRSGLGEIDRAPFVGLMLLGDDPKTADVYLWMIGDSQGAYHPILVTFVVKVFLYDLVRRLDAV